MKHFFLSLILVVFFTELRAQDEPFHKPDVYAKHRVRAEKVYKMISDRDSILLTSFIYDSVSGRQLSRQQFRDGVPGMLTTYWYDAKNRQEKEAIYLAGRDTAISISMMTADEKGRAVSRAYYDNKGRVQMIQTTVYHDEKGYSESHDTIAGQNKSSVKTFYNGLESPIVVEYYDSSGTLYGTAYSTYNKLNQVREQRSDFSFFKQRTIYNYNANDRLNETLEYWSSKKNDKVVLSKSPTVRNSFSYYANGLLYEFHRQIRNPTQQRLRRYYSFY